MELQATQQAMNYQVIFSGFGGGGKCLTGLRDYIGDKGYVIPSMSTRMGLRRGELRLQTHYKKLAEELIAQAKGKIIRIYAHSLGSIETIDLMKYLANEADLPHKTIEVIFISPPGIGQSGLSGLWKVVSRFSKVIKNLGKYDQYNILPLCTTHDTTPPKWGKFMEEWLPRLQSDETKRRKIEKKIRIIDSEILILQGFPELQKQFEAWYHKQRHELVKGLLANMLGGGHILEERHLFYQQQCRELVEDGATRLAYLVAMLTFTARSMNSIYRGLDARIIKVFEYCRVSGVEAKLGLAIMGKDELVHIEDYNVLCQLASEQNIPVYSNYFEQEEHASVAHKWELIDALEALTLKSV